MLKAGVGDFGAEELKSSKLAAPSPVEAGGSSGCRHLQQLLETSALGDWRRDVLDVGRHGK